MQDYFMCPRKECAKPILKRNPANAESWLRADGKPGGQHPGGVCIHCGKQYDMLVDGEDHIVSMQSAQEKADEKKESDLKDKVMAEVRNDLKDEIIKELHDQGLINVDKLNQKTVDNTQKLDETITPEDPENDEKDTGSEGQENIPIKVKPQKKVEKELESSQGVFGK